MPVAKGGLHGRLVLAPRSPPRTLYRVISARLEFDRQVQVLLDKGYPALAGMPEGAFVQLVSPLRETAAARGAGLAPPVPARVPFVLVVARALAPAERTMPLTTLDGKAKPGFVDRTFPPGDLDQFESIKEVQVPDPRAYLAFDVDRGEETRNVTPDDAMAAITAQGRTPITVDEGIALVTLFPESLEKNRCFSLAGSRRGDRRVPALWISQGAPKLGWCWAGNPHTWLGTASCADRAGPPEAA